MNRTNLRTGAALIAILSLVACTSDPDDGADQPQATAADDVGTSTTPTDGTTGSTASTDGADGSTTVATDAAVVSTTAPTPQDPGSTTGITDDTIRIGYLGADLAALAAAGIAPDLGDQEVVMRAFVDDVNANGGIAGRQIELEFQLVDPLAPETEQAGCLQMTQDFGAFAVIAAPGLSREATECMALANQTLVLAGGISDEDALYETAEGRLWDFAMSDSRLTRGWVTELDRRGLLDGRVGVIATDEVERTAVVEESLIATLEALGHEPVATVTLPCAEGDNDCDQHEAGIQQLKEADAEIVFASVGPLAIGPMLEAARNLDFHPRWSFSNEAVTATVAKFYEGGSDLLDGAVGMAGFDLTGDAFLSPDDEACAQVVVAAGEPFERGSDPAGFAVNLCESLRVFKRAVESVEGDVGQLSVIRALGEVGQIDPGDPLSGTWSADKHDAGDYAWFVSYDPEARVWVTADPEPVDLSGV